jgi:hypothetical protein
MAGVDSVTPQNLTTIDAVLKDLYLGPVRDVLNSKTILFRILSRNEEDISGRQAIIPLNITRNEGVGFIGDGALLPNPGKQGFITTSVPMQWGYGRIFLTGPTIAATRNDSGAFVRALDAEIQGLVRDKKHELNRVLFGNGSGYLAQVNAATPDSSAPVTFPVDNPGGFANVGPGTQYLRPGMRIGFVRSAALVATAQILSVDAINNTITLTATSTASPSPVQNNDWIVRVSQSSLDMTVPSGVTIDDSGYNNEPMGIAGIVNDGNPPTRKLQGIDATLPANAAWRAGVIDNAGTPVPLDLDTLQAALDLADTLGDGVPRIGITRHGQRRAYLDQLVPDKQFVNTMELDGGFRVLEYNMIPIVPDKDCTYGRWYWLDVEPMAIYRMSDFFWVDDDGAILRPAHADRHSWQATLAIFMELGTSARNRSVLIDDLEEAA